MCYITQPNGENSCGAYSTAYYLWHSGKVPYLSGAQAKKDVDAIYKEIKFGKKAPSQDFAVYSNPVRMLEYLTGTPIDGAPTPPANLEPVFHYNPKQDDVIGDLFNAMSTNHALDAAAIATLQGQHPNIISNVAPPLGGNANGYLIAICQAPEGLHYVLLVKKGKSITMINPWHGVEQSLTDEQISNSIFPGELEEVDEQSLHYLQAGIWIPSKK